MARQYVNLGDIYGQVDAARANQAQLQNNQLLQERQRRQFAMEDEQLAEQRRLKDIYRGSVTDKDGMPVLDEKRLISELYREAPEKALAVQEGFTKRDAEASKMQRENAKAELSQRIEAAKYARDRLSIPRNQQEYEAVLTELAEVAPALVKSAPPAYDPEWQNKQLYTGDDWIKKAENELNRGVTMRGQDITMRGQDMTDARTRAEGAANRGVTMRGQNLTNARGVQANQIAQDKALKPPKTALSSSAQKELFEADEMVQASKNAIGMLREAKKLNNTAYSGIGAKPRAVIASNLGMGTGGADDTINLDNLMTGQALESLKATFGGMPTEGERKILLDIQASADKTPAQRKSILDRAEQAAMRRIKFNQSKAKSLRSGTYFTEQAPEQEVPTTRDVRSEADKILGL